MALISNGNGTAQDTATGNTVELTTQLPAGVDATGYQVRSTPSPTSGTDDTARFFGGLATSVIQGGSQIATAAFGGAAQSAFPGTGAKPAAAPNSGFMGLSYVQLGIGAVGLLLLADYFTGKPFGLFRKWR